MKKIVSGFIFLLLFLVFPYKTSAYYIEKQGSNNHSGYTFAINAYNDEPNPTTYIKDTTPVKINITARDAQGNPASIFNTDDYYMILFSQPGFECKRGIDLKGTFYTSQITTKSASSLDFLVPNKDPGSYLGVSCDLPPGTYSIRLSSRADSNPWVVFDGESGFAINSPTGGGSAKLVPTTKENLICKDTLTEVRIENAEVGKVFNVYWKGDQKTYAWMGRAPERNFTVPLTGGDGNLKPGTKPGLCLIEGEVKFIPALEVFSCPNPLEFDYSTDESKCANSTKKSCSASVQLMENNTAKKQAIISGSKFPPSITARGDLIDKKNPTAEPKRFPNLAVSSSGSVTVSTGELAAGDYAFNFYTTDTNELLCPVDNINVKEGTETGNAPGNQPAFQTTKCVDGNCAKSSGVFCNTASGKAVQDGDPVKSGDGVLTAIGCIPTDPSRFIAGLMKYITGFSGGVALLLMVFGAFQMVTSAGNAESLKKGREQFVSAVIGLLFVIFAVLLLQITGVDILGLPGFTK